MVCLILTHDPRVFPGFTCPAYPPALPRGPRTKTTRVHGVGGCGERVRYRIDHRDLHEGQRTLRRWYHTRDQRVSRPSDPLASGESTVAKPQGPDRTGGRRVGVVRVDPRSRSLSFSPDCTIPRSPFNAQPQRGAPPWLLCAPTPGACSLAIIHHRRTVSLVPPFVQHSTEDQACPLSSLFHPSNWLTKPQTTTPTQHPSPRTSPLQREAE